MFEEKTSVYSISVLSKSQAAHAYLIFISAKSTATVGKMFKIDPPEAVLGRSPDATLRIEDDGISRKHCKVLVSAEGRYQLVDLGSTNGTFLNGKRVDMAALQDGDKIQIGSNTILKFSIQDQLEEQYQRSIYESATRDHLTRMYNKKYFMETLRKEYAYCVRHQVPLSVVMLDVDHFKHINDNFGHPAGDFLLQRLAQRLNETVRTEDLLARYGGEEFALILRESPMDKAVICAERCRRAIDQMEFNFNGTVIRATISLGVATLFDTDTSNAEDLVGVADKYLYKAKQAGRNCVAAKSLNG